MTVHCYFCDREKDDREAVYEGWTPSFWEDEDTQIDCPSCPECAVAYLNFDGDEPVLGSSEEDI